MSVTASAPGKLLLLGDHAVVYQRPCLVTAVDIRVRVEITEQDTDTLDILTPELTARGERRTIPLAQLHQERRRETAFVEAAVAHVFEKAQQQRALRIVTHSAPRSYGLGSSSAVTASTVAALAALLDLRLDQKALFDLAYAAVLDVQGTGSGFDVASAIYGGTIYYMRGGAVIEPLDVGDLPFVIGYSGEKVGTVNLVKQVARLRDCHPTVINPLFDLIHTITDQGRDCLLRRDWAALGDLINIHQGLLDSLGVNVPQLARLIFAARSAGASGAKLSGAGGGDCMYALVDETSCAAVKAALRHAGGEVIDQKLHAPGVCIV